ncbi:MAG: ExeM/NucH family extracellular endonuclease [Desulfococcaceae bacterium]
MSARFFAVSGLLVFLMTFFGFSGVALAQTAVFINEIHYDNDGADTGEAVEIAGPAGTDLTGWRVVLYNGNGGGSYGEIPLSGAIPDQCGGFGTVARFQAGIQNGSPDGLALVNDLNQVVQFLSYEGAFAAVDGPAAGTTSVDIGASESGATPVGASLQLSGTGFFAEDFAWASPQPETFGDCNAGQTFSEGSVDELNCEDAFDFTPISAIQGEGAESPLLGASVVVEGVVVGDFQNNELPNTDLPPAGFPDNGDLNGFFVQSLEDDGNPATSEGIFVFASGADIPDVVLGDRVRVRGTVEEFFGQTQLGSVTATVCGALPLPAPAELIFPLDSAEDFEAYEGMRVAFPQPLVISEYFNFDRFGEIVLALPADGQDRPFQPTAVFEPFSPEAEALADLNARGRITLDDGRASQNPDPAIHPNGMEFDLANRFRGGDLVENATGVLSYAFGRYRLQPTQGANYTATNPREENPAPVGGRLTAASFNVLNYFLTLDDAGPICGPDQNLGCRGADDAEEFERQRAKILAALAAIEADVFGLIEMENTTGVEPLADIAAGLNDLLGSGRYDFIDTGVIGTDAIRVGILYNTDTVAPAGGFAILDGSVDPRFNDDKNRPVLAQSFEEIATGEMFTVAVNHLKSKGSACGDGDDDPAQGNCNGTRTDAARAMVEWLAADPTGAGDPDVLITGDLNAYDKEDPIFEILAGPDGVLDTEDDYLDLIAEYEGELAYSFVFDGQFGYLDHALANPSMAAQVTGVTEWHINADEPDILDYDTTFKKDAQDALFEENPFRSSDHDPVIVGLSPGSGSSINCDGAVASIAEIWPPNRKLIPVSIEGVESADGGPVTITIDAIFQDEPVNGWFAGVTAPDAAGVGESVARVRAERLPWKNGRVYHIFFTAENAAGATCSGEATVGVPTSQGRWKRLVDDGPLYDSTVRAERQWPPRWRGLLK